jgi:hypothetical protein
MDCREFKDVWNQLLDAETAGSRDLRCSPSTEPRDQLSALEAAARGHAAVCPSCHAVEQELELLRLAMRQWLARPLPKASPELTERILGVLAADPPTFQADPLGCQPVPNSPRMVNLGRSRYSLRVLLAIAAGLLIAAPLLQLRWGGFRSPTGLRRPDSAAVADSSGRSPRRGALASRPLRETMAAATSATWALALATSRPAARWVIEVVGDAEEPILDSPSPRSGLKLVAAPEPLVVTPRIRFEAEAIPATELLQHVGEQVAAGVRPLSEAARQAFGFLRRPNLDTLDRTDRPAAMKGA